MRGQQFLAAILGPQGVEVLQKAAERLPDLEAVIVPRAVIAYLENARAWNYEGPVPGTGARIEKQELCVGADRHGLAPQTFLRAAGALTLHVAGDVSIPTVLDPRSVARLCKGVAALSKAKFLARIRVMESASESKSDSDSDGSVSASLSVPTSEGSLSISISSAGSSAGEDSGSDVEKGTDLPGRQAPPGAPKAPVGPVPQKKAPGTGTRPLMRSESFLKAELLKSCRSCGHTQMRGRQFVGCMCITDVVQGAVVVKAESEVYTVTGAASDVAAIDVVLRA